MFLHEWPQVREIAETGASTVSRRGHRRGRRERHRVLALDVRASRRHRRCVLGEGEATVVELVDRVLGRCRFDGLPGTSAPATRRQALEAGLPPRRPQAGSRVPRPAWDLFPDRRLPRAPDFFGVNRGRSMPVLATRGCPYKCTFCSSPQMWTTRYVVRDPDDVADEIADYVERVRGPEHQLLRPDRHHQAPVDPALLRRARRSATSTSPGSLPVGTRSEALDDEVLQRLWDTGCRNITYAPESGSRADARDLRQEGEPRPHARLAAEAHRIGLRTHVNIIIGHPEEPGATWRTPHT